MTSITKQGIRFYREEYLQVTYLLRVKHKYGAIRKLAEFEKNIIDSELTEKSTFKNICFIIKWDT